MAFKKISQKISIGAQLTVEQVKLASKNGFRSIICNLPDNEAEDQTNFSEIEKVAKAEGMQAVYLPILKVEDKNVVEFIELMRRLPKPVLAYCRSGSRSVTLWCLSQATKKPLSDILDAAQVAGFDMSAIVRKIANNGKSSQERADYSFDIVIVGAGAGGIATAASLKARDSSLEIAIIDPADTHYYQPGFTLVGRGVFKPHTTAKTMGSIIPTGVKWIKAPVVAFEPNKDCIVLEGCRIINYKRLIVSPGLKLDWDKIEGLSEALGRNGVTSNYRYDLAPYTWELVQGLQSGRALFTQPPMPIKCAGAPQKALYLSADYWYRKGNLSDITIDFHNAGGVLFGVKEYVPALMKYIKKYNANLNFFNNLVGVDGVAKQAYFDVAQPDKTVKRIKVGFDMLHVCPPQCAPDFIRVSDLADKAGWVDVDQETLRHKKYDNIWSLGDVCNTPNAKTAAAARKQAPVIADNIVSDIKGERISAAYDGYGSCPLTVEKGKIVLAEFVYGGKLAPSFPEFFLDGTKATRAAWFLKQKLLPPIYWKAMLKGKEWMAKPEEFKVK